MSANLTKEMVDGLPKQFVSSLRILFDILDETGTGVVRLRDIESRWSDDGTRGLPSGVIDGLRRVTPANGLLSFDRFVAGLKLVLRKKREDGRWAEMKENRIPLQEFGNLGGGFSRDVGPLQEFNERGGVSRDGNDRGTNSRDGNDRGTNSRDDRGTNSRDGNGRGTNSNSRDGNDERGTNSRDGNDRGTNSRNGNDRGNSHDRGINSRDEGSNKLVNNARDGDKLYDNGNKEIENNQNRSKRQHLSMKGTFNTEHRSHRDSYYDGHNPREGRRSPPVQALKGGSVSRGVSSQTSYVIKPEVSNYPAAMMGSHHPPPNSAGIFRQGIGSNQISQDRAPTIPPRSDRPQRTSYSPNMKKSLSGPNLASKSHSPPAVPPRSQHQSALILSDLKNWQSEWTVKQQNGDMKYGHGKVSQTSRSSNQDNGIYANIEQFQRKSDADFNKHPSSGPHKADADFNKHPSSGPHKATVQRHGSGRRHTLANGIDQNMMKRMKQLEEETSMLRSGLSMVDSARDWYMKQLTQVSDKQAMLGKVTYNDNSVEAHQERMNFQQARIAEINQHLQTLLESSEKGFPIHMNLAVSASTNKSADNITLQRLREQNRQLREEVGQKKDHISQLEKEKATLVRDLFEVRSKNNSGHDDTTFM